jgi:hypothetical protein
MACKIDLLFVNGDKMPAVGLGTWRAPDAEVELAINAALEAGTNGENPIKQQHLNMVFMVLIQVIATSTVHRCTATKKSLGRSSASGLILEESREVIYSSRPNCRRSATALQMLRSV